MFCSCTQPEVKTEIIHSIRISDSNLHVVIATIAFCMGIDCSIVHRIIHLGPPESIGDYVQQIGRGERDGSDASATLIYGKHFN
uniref:DNA 3'-5' helicase n=1 Tax=Amphimedon queenslandica TaxID=400682 RepID=A0A1X7USL4_AMPQE